MSKLKYYDGTNWKTVNGQVTGDTLPIGTEVDYIGDSVPAGWEQVSDYSTSEINTGKTWIDGKPLYRKTFVSTSSSRSESISITDLSINEAFFDFTHSYFSFSSPGRNTPIVNTQVGATSSTNAETGNQSGVYFNSSFTTIFIETGVNWSGTAKKVITIEYTKTTD